MHDPERQRLIEVFSGHGNSELFRAWREIEFAEDGQPVCPAPTRDYLPDLLARGRDHPRALSRRGRGRGGVRAARGRGARARRGRGRGRVQDRARRGAGRLARRRPVSRLRRARVQLPPEVVGAVHRRARQLRRTGCAAPLPVRLHRVERQPLRPARHRLQAEAPPRHDRVAGRRRAAGSPRHSSAWSTRNPPRNRARSRSTSRASTISRSSARPRS